METDSKDSLPEEQMPEWKRALVRMTAEHLATVDPMDRWPCLTALSPRQLAKMLTYILTVWGEVEEAEHPEDRETYDRILELLGRVVNVLTAVELQRWAPEIAIARNRALTDRQPIEGPEELEPSTAARHKEKYEQAMEVVNRTLSNRRK